MIPHPHMHCRTCGYKHPRHHRNCETLHKRATRPPKPPPKKCLWKKCNRMAHSRGVCEKHYYKAMTLVSKGYCTLEGAIERGWITRTKQEMQAK